MIDFISSWTQGIIIAVIVGTIVEMIVPNGSSKKYIKVVIGIYVLFNIVVPVINKVSNGNIDLAEIIASEVYSKETEFNNKIAQNINTDNTYNIKELYMKNLKKDIKEKIEDKGYTVKNIQIEIENNEEYTIKNITLKLAKKDANEEKEERVTNIIKIEEVNISISKEQTTIQEDESSKLTEKEKNEIKEYLSDVYSVKTKNISIN